MEDDYHMPKSTQPSFDMSRFRVDEKKVVKQHDMMGMIPKEWRTKKYNAMWAGLIKKSGITPFDLERIVAKGLSLKDYSPRGFVRNRLINKDWHKFF